MKKMKPPLHGRFHREHLCGKIYPSSTDWKGGYKMKKQVERGAAPAAAGECERGEGNRT